MRSGTRRGRNLWRNVPLLATCVTLAGCAAHYTDANGAQHVVGLVDMVIRPADSRNLAGSIVDVRSVGLSYLHYEDRGGIGLGYQHVTIASLRDNAVALGPFDRVEPTTGPTSNRGP